MSKITGKAWFGGNSESSGMLLFSYQSVKGSALELLPQQFQLIKW